jgi:hypothetical protein
MESDTTTQPALGDAARASSPAQEAATTTREARRGGARDAAQAGAAGQSAPGQGAQANGADGQLAFSPAGAEAGQAVNGAGESAGRAEGQQDGQRRGERRQRGRRDDSSATAPPARVASSGTASVTVTSVTGPHNNYSVTAGTTSATTAGVASAAASHGLRW